MSISNILPLLKISLALAGAMTAMTASALPTSYYAESSRLATDARWVKVKVTETGVHKITYDRLRQWGFSNPEQVHVYGFSGPELYENTLNENMPDDLPQQYCEHIDNALYFFGEGDIRLSMLSDYDLRRRRNHYNTFSCYFLSDAPVPETTAEFMPFTEQTSTAVNHVAIDYKEFDEFNPGEAGVFWFSTPMHTGDSRTYSFKAEDFVADAYITYIPASNSSSSQSVVPTLGPNMEMTVINTEPVRHNTGDDSHLIYNKLPNPSNLKVKLTPGVTDYSISFSGPSDNSWIAIDYACMMYRRHNRLADHPQLKMFLRNVGKYTNLKISEARADTRVWNATAPMSVMPMETSFDAVNSTIEVSPATSDPLLLVTFNPGAEGLPEPTLIGEVTDCPDLHGDTSDFDMLIITNKMFMDAARRLADIHQKHQGLRVKIVDHDDIFNEFSSGAPSAIAYRRYVKMIYDRKPGMLKYLLLLGQGTYDHRFIKHTDDKSFVFTYQVEEDRALGYSEWTNYEVSNFSSDNYFGMMSEDFTIRNVPQMTTEIAVGRIPAQSTGHAKMLIDKIENYFDTYLTSDNFSRSIIMSDEGDKNAHLEMSEDAKAAVLDNEPSVMPMKLYRALYRGSATSDDNLVNIQNDFHDMIENGASTIFYSGHSGTTEVASAFTLPVLHKLNWPEPSIAFFATCTNNFIDRPTLSFGQTLFNKDKGLVGLIASGRTAYLNRNKALLVSFIENYYNPRPGDCLGDLWRKAFNTVCTTLDVSYGINSLTYNLVGDPALPIPRRTHSALITKINGTDAENDKITARAMTPLTVSGTITDAEGNVDTRFNGKAIVTIYDGEQNIVTPATSADPSATITVNHKLLARTGVEVKNGHWTATLCPPVGNVIGSTNTVQVWAHSEGTSNVALGMSRALSLTDPAGSAATGKGPEIAEMFIDTPDFTDGDYVHSSFTLHALIESGPTGIRVSNDGIGRRATLALDGNSMNVDASNLLRWNNDGSATLSYAFEHIADGNHTLTLSVSDNAGNITERSISFAVSDRTLHGVLHADTRIVTGSTRIYVDIPSSARLTRVVVEDAAHNTVVSRSLVSFPWNWTPDASLPDGQYFVRAYFKDGVHYGSTDPLEIILIRN